MCSEEICLNSNVIFPNGNAVNEWLTVSVGIDLLRHNTQRSVVKLPELKLFRDKEMTEEIPFVGFGEDPVEMGETGKTKAYIVNLSNYEYYITELNHENPNAIVDIKSDILEPNVPVEIELTWTPPFSEDEKDWKPLKGNIRMNGYYVIR